VRFFDTSLCPVNTTVLANGTPCAFQIPVANTYGNSGRSILYGPSTKNWDLGLQRKFKIYENMAISLRFDAFNAFNTPNFATPNAELGSSSAGQITGTINDNRDLQLSATFTF
jgi:hypothetical protein